MSITKAIYQGQYVYASEELKGKIVQCVYCGCDMYARRFPGRSERYFACMPGVAHTNEVCQKYENKTMPVYPESPEAFISKLLIPGKDKSDNGPDASGVEIGTSRPPKPEIDGPKPVSKMASLMQMLKTGIFAEDAEALVYDGAGYRYLDYVILRKWGPKIWQSKHLEPIGIRIIDALWVGSLAMGKDSKEERKGMSSWERKMARFLGEKKELWLTLNGRCNGKTTFIRLCLDCKSCLEAVRDKLFVAGDMGNGTYNKYIPREQQIEVFTAARWVTMSKDDCREKCPLYIPGNPHLCDGCIGAYWGKCNSAKQIALVKDKYKFTDTKSK